MPAGLEEVSSGIGASIGRTVSTEGGLGPTASTTAKVEVGAMVPAPEIGSVGNLKPGAAGLAEKLDATLSTPNIGIHRVAEVDVPGIVQGPMGTPEESLLNKPSGMEVPARGSEPAAPPITGVENGTGPAAKPEEITTVDKEDAKSPEDAAKAKQTQELEGKVKDRTATPDEIKELRDLKQDPEQHRKDLEQKALDGTITDEEAQELGDLNSKEAVSNLTPEQQMEKLQKDIDELGTELMKKMANGEEVTKEDLEKLRNLRGQESLINKGFTPEQVRSAMREAERRGGRGNERQARTGKEIEDKIRELMALELQLLSIPKNVEALRAQKKQAQDEAQAKHIEANSTTTPEERLRKKGEEYKSYMKIADIIGKIIAQKHMVPVLEARRQDLEQYVRRKLGVIHGFGALMEFAAAKVRNVATEVGVGAAEEMDYKTGNY